MDFQLAELLKLPLADTLEKTSSTKVGQAVKKILNESLETLINKSIFNTLMQTKNPSHKLKREFKIAEDFLDLRTTHTNVLVEQMEEMIKARELCVEKRMRLRV